MTLPRLLHRIVAFATRRPALVVGLTVVLALAGSALALRLEPDAGTDTLVGESSASYEATELYRERFGDDAVIVLVKGDLSKLVLTSDIQRLLALEGCISGNVPDGVSPPGGADGPCAALSRTKPVKVVFGPGTFINESVGQLTDQFGQRQAETQARAEAAAQAARKEARKKGLSKAQADARADDARQLVMKEFQSQILQLALRYGITSLPQLNNPSFVSQLVFDSTKPAGTPKRRFAYLFPSSGDGPGKAALVQVRLKPDLSEAQRRDAIGHIREAVAMKHFSLRNGGTYTVTGAPVVVDDLTSSITGSIVALLIAALLVMAATLALVFSSRLRLLPLAIALVAGALTFGGLSLAGASLTMASVAVLPVLIGLAVDYAIQLQSRISEERAGGLDTARAARRAALLGAPTIATAAAATAAGFLVLVLSPVPMVRGFGLLLVVGIVIALAVALLAGAAALVLAERGTAPPRLARLGARLLPALRGARDLIVGNRLAHAAHDRGVRLGRASLRAAVRNPSRVLAAALAVAALGWVLDTQTAVESDIQKLVPQDLTALRDLEELQTSTGVGGAIDVVVQADDLTEPEVVSWMVAYQEDLLKQFGYSAERGCGRAELCPAFSLPDLFTTPQARQDAQQIDALLDAVPPYFSQAVITDDRTVAALSFGIRLMPLAKQKDVIDEMRTRLAEGKPEGVRAELAGLPVLAAEANAQVSSHPRRLLTLLVGLLAVAGVLFLAFRRAERALVPLVPIALATGWSALVLFLTRVPLNPMTVTLGALVIAISTEFSVLLSERFRQEREAGHETADALERTYRSTGAAVLASGATAVAGFAVLVISDIRMLRDFGFVTVVDLSVSLVGVLLVLPSVLVLAERGELAGLPRVWLSRLRAWRPGRPTLRRPRLRRPRVAGLRPRLGQLARPRLRRRRRRVAA